MEKVKWLHFAAYAASLLMSIILDVKFPDVKNVICSPLPSMLNEKNRQPENNSLAMNRLDAYVNDNVGDHLADFEHFHDWGDYPDSISIQLNLA